MYHSSSAVSPLQTSYVSNTNSRHNSNGNNTSQDRHYQHLSNSSTLPFSLYQHSDSNDQLHRNVPDLATYDRQVSRRHYRRKHRSKHERKKQQQQQALTTNETSFERAQQLGMPESRKISYPHYYEDGTTNNCPESVNGEDYDCAALSDEYEPQHAQPQQQQHYNSLTTGRIKKSTSAKRYFFSTSELKLTELQFRDVGQEINV